MVKEDIVKESADADMETKYLTANDEMKNKLLEGMREKLKDCVSEDKVKW